MIAEIEISDIAECDFQMEVGVYKREGKAPYTLSSTNSFFSVKILYSPYIIDSVVPLFKHCKQVRIWIPHHWPPDIDPVFRQNQWHRSGT